MCLLYSGQVSIITQAQIVTNYTVPTVQSTVPPYPMNIWRQTDLNNPPYPMNMGRETDLNNPPYPMNMGRETDLNHPPYPMNNRRESNFKETLV